MAAKGSTFAADILKLIFQALPISLLADNTGTTPLTSLYLSLHTASPGAAGNQTTHEAAYTSYARIAVTRDNTGWSISGTTITPAADLVWPTATGGSETETYWGIGTDATTGAAKLLYFGPISPPIVVTTGVIPTLSTLSSVQEQ